MNRDDIINYLTDRCQECYDNCAHPKYYPAAGMCCEYKNQWVDHHGGPQKICLGCNGFQPTEETKRYREILEYINELEAALL